MNEIKVFNSNEFGEIRTVMVDGEPWFVGKDVADSLGYSNTRDALTKHVDNDDKGVAKCDTLGGTQDVVIVNESGLYSLIFGSKLDSAKAFKRWVTSEVLPSLRKTGEYKLVKPDSYMIEDPAERARRWAEEYDEKVALEQKNNSLQRTIDVVKPKAELFDQFLDSSTLVNFRDCAKQLDISQTQFTGWLLDNGVLYRDSGGELKPTEKFMPTGWFAIRSYTNPINGFSSTRTFITPKGVAVFRVFLNRNGGNRTNMRKHGGRKKKNNKYTD